MRKSLLNLYMQKVASGDLSYLDRLCKQLADRLVFTPINSSSSSGGSNAKTTFSVLRLSDNGNSQVLLFTTEKRFKEWSQKAQHQAGSISLLGADFCAALGANTWISLDKGYEDEIVLDPVFVAKVSSSTSQDESLEEEPSEDEHVEGQPQAEPSRPATPAPDRGLARGAIFASEPMPEEYIPRSVARAASSAPITLTKPIDEDEPTPPPSSKLMRSAIFSPEPLPSAPVRPERQSEEETEPKKKKSFLNFLKGN